MRSSWNSRVCLIYFGIGRLDFRGAWHLGRALGGVMATVGQYRKLVTTAQFAKIPQGRPRHWPATDLRLQSSIFSMPTTSHLTRMSRCFRPPEHQNRTAILLLSLALMLGACSTQISALKPTTEYSVKSPKVSYVYRDVGTTLRVATETTLLPGTYKPIGQNEQGVWYVGAERNVQIFYTEKKRSDGKRLLASYTGGVLVPLKPDSSPTLFIIPSTQNFVLISDSLGTEAAGHGSLTAGQIQSEAAINAGTSNPVGAAVGGVIADGLLAYDAKGLRMIPQTTGAPGLVAWLDGR